MMWPVGWDALERGVAHVAVPGLDLVLPHNAAYCNDFTCATN
jgi:hypothetical protein